MTASEDRRTEEQAAGGVNLMIFKPALHRYFRRRADVADVDDLVQDVFLNMHERRENAPILRPEQYLFSVAANVLKRYRGKQANARRGTHEAALADMISQDLLSPERHLLGKEELDRVRAVLQKLSPRVRDAFILHRFEHRTYPQIANDLNISVSTVEKHIMAALRALLLATCAELGDD